MLKLVLTLIAALAGISLTRAAPPATQPSGPAANFVFEQRQAMRNARTEAQAMPAKPIDSFIRFDVVDGHLRTTLLNAEGPPEQTFDPEAGGDSVFRLTVQKDTGVPNVVAFSATLMKLDPATPRSIFVQLLPAPLQVNLSITEETLGGTTTVQLIENAAPNFNIDGSESNVRLYLAKDSADETVAGAGNGRMSLLEPTFADLIEKHHDDVVATVGEGLTTLRAMHVLAGVGQDEAKAIFEADRKIDQATRRELHGMVDSIRRDGNAAVLTARPRLRELGSAAAAELARFPRDGWSADLSLNVDALTAGMMPVANSRGASLLASPARLIDLLYSPDANLRAEAKVRLERLLDRKIAIDTGRDPYADADAIESLRPALSEPTTRP